MNYTEVRIGNHITDEWADKPIGFKISSFNTQTVTYGNRFKCRWKNARAIDLTPEILNIFGFFITDEDYYFQQHLYYNKDLDFKIAVNDIECTVKAGKRSLLYLHELQNFVQINTGTELQINL